LGAYLLGSLPTGYLMARARGVDIRKVGSGNIGATNVFRILGRAAGILVLIVDALKGLVACTLVSGLADRTLNPSPGTAVPESLRLLAGVCVVLGHNYSCWLRFHGGKGIATSAGVLIALVPRALLICLVLWGLTFGLGRYVSLASLVAAMALPFAVWLTGGSGPLLAIMSLLALLAVYTHRANIRRLLQGTEHRFGKTTDSPAS
jgi:glycerol-3-phosphate acyltransferase PlsY